MVETLNLVFGGERWRETLGMKRLWMFGQTGLLIFYVNFTVPDG